MQDLITRMKQAGRDQKVDLVCPPDLPTSMGTELVPGGSHSIGKFFYFVVKSDIANVGNIILISYMLCSFLWNSVCISSRTKEVTRPSGDPISSKQQAE